MGEEEPQREKWGSKAEFILSCLGYAVGLGNVWRFPYLCGRNGGAAFLVPYLIMMAFAGLPVFYMEMAIGQYSGVTPGLLYKRMSPIFTGIGPAMILTTFLTAMYYNMIVGWALYYFGISFQFDLPYSHCNRDWGTDYCYEFGVAEQCDKDGLLYWQGGCVNATENQTQMDFINNFWNMSDINGTKTSPAEEYLHLRMLQDSGTIANIGTPRWELVLSLLGAWVLVFLTLIKGIQSAGKIVYFTATFPYVILIILLIRGNTLDGSELGVDFYFLKPDWSKLADINVWSDAAQQIFFSLSVGGGGLTTLSSYSEFNNNLLRDTLIVVLGNCCTSFFAGFVIFPILGFMSKQVGKPVAEIAAEGTTLAFVAYPDAIARMPVSPLWAILFFGMLIMLGINTQVVLTEVSVTAILDYYPHLRKDWKKKTGVVGAVCFVLFLLGLILTCNGGSEFLNLLDTYAGGYPLVIACCVEVCMVSYCYGYKRFVSDISLMMGLPPNKFWRYLGYPTNPFWLVNWVIITPILLFLIMMLQFIFYKTDVDAVSWEGSLGWGFTAFCVSPIPIFAIYMYVQYILIKKKPLKWLITPSDNWLPNDSAEAAKIRQARGEIEMGVKSSTDENGDSDNKAFQKSTESLNSKADKVSMNAEPQDHKSSHTSLSSKANSVSSKQKY